MPQEELNNIIGMKVRYFDYIGSERFGKIIAVEPSQLATVYYCYIEDDEPDENTHQDIVNNQNIQYAAIRPSIELYLL